MVRRRSGGDFAPHYDLFSTARRVSTQNILRCLMTSSAAWLRDRGQGAGGACARIAPIANAPAGVVRTLAKNDDISVPARY
jgi:hypothetical protein